MLTRLTSVLIGLPQGQQQDNVPVKSKTQHPPGHPLPWHLNFWKNCVQMPPPPLRAKKPFKYPTIVLFQVIKNGEFIQEFIQENSSAKSADNSKIQEKSLFYPSCHKAAIVSFKILKLAILASMSASAMICEPKFNHWDT